MKDMKDLKEKTAYYLGDLNEEQLRCVSDWLYDNKHESQYHESNNNVEQWVKALKKDNNLSLHKHKDNMLWGFKKTDYEVVNALTLFTEIDFEVMRKCTLEQLLKYTPCELIEYYEKELGIMKKHSLTHEDVRKEVKKTIKGDNMPINYDVLKALHETTDDKIRITKDAWVDNNGYIQVEDVEVHVKVKTYGELKEFMKYIR